MVNPRTFWMGRSDFLDINLSTKGGDAAESTRDIQKPVVYRDEAVNTSLLQSELLKCDNKQGKHEEKNEKGLKTDEVRTEKIVFQREDLNIHGANTVPVTADSSAISYTCDQTKKELQCPICLKDFRKKFNLRRHFTKCHTETGSVMKCQVTGCERMFGSRSLLRRHVDNHKEKSFRCDVCYKQFRQISLLNRHKKLHTDQRPFECDVCSKMFKTQDSLTKHSRIHESTKRFCCNLCNKEFSHSSTLQRHVTVHIGSKEHKCLECGIDFRNKVSLDIHTLRMNHSVSDVIEEEALECSVCYKRFPVNCKSLFMKHILTHSDERPYKCSLCPKAYNDKSNLNYHMKIHDEHQEIYKCDLCRTEYRNKRIYAVHLKSSKHLQRAAAVDTFAEQTVERTVPLGTASYTLTGNTVLTDTAHMFETQTECRRATSQRNIVHLALAEAQIDKPNESESQAAQFEDESAETSQFSTTWTNTTSSTVSVTSRLFYHLTSGDAVTQGDMRCYGGSPQHEDSSLQDGVNDKCGAGVDQVNEGDTSQNADDEEERDNTASGRYLEDIDNEKDTTTISECQDTGLTESDEEMFANEYFNSGFHHS